MQAPGKQGVIGGLVALAIWVAGAAVAGAADDMDRFYGVWLGSAVTESKTDQGKEVTARELYASLLPADDGFTMEWAAIRRRGVASDDDQPILMQVAQFVETDRKNMWRSDLTADPMGGVYTYARLVDNTLIVYTIGVDETGALETQIYRRSVADGEMQLEYTRVVDGVQVRTVKGTLTKSE